MKTRNCFYFLIILSTFLIFCWADIEDSCPAGMRKTYVDDYNMVGYGSARPYLAAVSFFQFPGSLFFKRKVLIEPRFEVHLKASTDPIDIVENQRENKLYGYTIVISGYKNTISGLEGRVVKNNENLVFDDIGYNNYVNSLIIEFDFEKDTYDPDSSSFSIRFCDTSCHSSDRYASVSGKLNNQRYDPSKANNWDFRLIYNTKKFTLYSGPNEVLYSTNYDLEAALGTNIAFVGFTGFIESNRRELSIIGTFICEDNYQIAKMPGYFYLNGGLYESAGYQAGTPINYLFSFINDKDQEVPHTFGYDIWDYNFTLNTDCDQTSYKISKETNYTLILSMRACTKAGVHSINIAERNKGNAPLRYYIVNPGPLNKITLIGHDGIIGTVPTKWDDEQHTSKHLTYGDSLSGDFVIKPNLRIILDFEMTDQYGNIVTVDSPSTLFSLQKVNGEEISSVSSNIISYTMQKVDEHYQMTINVNKIGTYQIEKNDYMSEAIRFNIIPGEVNPTVSYCTLARYTSPPTLFPNVDVEYNCYLRDDDGNEIDTKTFIANSIYEFSCSTERTEPTSKTYSTPNENKDTFYSCHYTTGDLGVFQINGYLTKKGTSANTKINPKINQFSVRGDGDSLLLKNVLNLYNRNWLNMNGAEITYVYDQKGLITALDLAEADGETLISSYGQYPEGFKVENVKATLFTSHDYGYTFNLLTKIIVIDGAEYIGLYTSDESPTDTIIKKSSFEYSIKVTLKNQEKVVTLKYILNIGTYTTCFHPFKKENTNLEQDYNIELLIGGAERKIGKMELKTDDWYLYNYDILKEGKKIEYKLQGDSTAITFRIVPLQIDGTYDIYAKATKEFSGTLYVYVDNYKLREQYIVAQPSKACYLEFRDPSLFKHLSTNFKEHYYEYLGDFVDGNLLFYFKILDKYNNTLIKDDYFSADADIYSEQFGNGINIFNVFYNHDVDFYQFRDNLPFESRMFSWVFFMRDTSCNNKYYIKYDGMRGGTPVSLEKSYYNLLKNEINVKEFAYIDVYYKDINDQLLGIQEGKLEEMISATKVTAKKGDKTVTLALDSKTSSYALRYKANFTEAGTYSISVKANSTSIQGNYDTLNVIDNVYSLGHSKLQLILDSIIDMDPNIRVTIDNTVQEPIYKLYFYSASGVKTTCNEDDKFTCTMTGPDNVALELNVLIKTDYVQFTHKEEDKETFIALSSGDFSLTVSDYKNSVDYPLHLTGDGSNDTSNDPNYVINKTEVYPTHINGIAGKTYTINLEFRVKDGFRWNYVVDPTLFTFENSYGLSKDQFTVSVEKGYKRGQALVYVMQKKVTNGTDNILTIKYKNEKIPKTVSLTIKCAEFKRLQWKEGPTEGNVINPPIITFIPLDTYDNLYTDLFTNPTTQEYLNSLTVGKSLDNVPLNSYNYLEDDNYLKVQYLSTISTNVTVTSSYFSGAYNYRIRSGPIDKDTSYAELITTDTNEVGNEYHIIIYPKDKYNNDIDGLNENDMNEFFTYYDISGSTDKYNVSECILSEENDYKSKLRQLLIEENYYNIIGCKSFITKTGTMQFHVDYIEDEIECRNCAIFLISNNIVYKNTKTLYKNKNVYLETDKLNEVQAKVDPVFELTFFDEYLNQLGSSIVQALDIAVTLEGADIKLCVSNSGNKKVVNLCPATDGDDNVNKWQYITNGNYSLIVEDQKDKDIITYPIKITGGANDGSSEEADLTKTNFNPQTITVVAGVEGKTVMEIRTAEDIRKNYWYPNPSEKIKVDFNTDKDSCSYRIEKGDLPGRYQIIVTCTKANNNNGFYVTVENTKLENKKIKLIVVSGPAYYLEVEEVEDKFTVSSDKYTWKKNPTNDDNIIFSFKLKDKYQNYINTSVIDKNEITVISETYGTSKDNYLLYFSHDKNDYLFKDTINEPITKHVWNIICVESNRKYSFIYTKEPGKPDVSQSSWTIDKTAYILYDTSIVLVTLKDRLGVNVGTVEGKLTSEKDKVVVSSTANSKAYEYKYNSVTNDNNLKYTYSYQLIGSYEVSVTYDGEEIPENKNITVSYQEIDLKTSKLYYDLFDGKEILMLISTATNINNKEEYLFYKFYLYTAEGQKITVYNKKVNVTCKMTYANSLEWDLDVSKEDDHFKLSYIEGFKDTFQRLPLGNYYLEITLDGEIIKYPLQLLGEKDVSPSPNYDLTKTYIKPTYIDGIAGQQYEIDIEFRAGDNLRWNYEIVLSQFAVSNSYNLDADNLNIVKKKGEKSGQMKLLVTQKVASYGGADNVLSFTYKNGQIPTTVTLHIKSDELYVLEYHSGAEDGTVINPSIVKFIPKDKYGNLCTDLFDETKYDKEKLEELTKGISEEGHELTPNNFVSDGQYLNVQYGCKKVTTIKLTLNKNLNPNTYRYKLWSGPISSEESYAEVEKTEGVTAGDITKLTIYPKDIYGNDVTNVTSEDLEKFIVDYEVNKDTKKDISDTCEIEDGFSLLEQFKCQTNVTKSGEIEFSVDYNNKPVNCRNCKFIIKPDKIDFSKTKVYNKNENKEMSRTELNTLPVTILPNFELHFFDRFMNSINDANEVKQLDVETEIVVTDVKLCVSNNELFKLSSVCPSVGFDENEERWKYLPNGDDYQLIVTSNNENLTFPVELTGGYNGGEPGPVDPSKTYLAPTEKTLVAGEEGSISLQLRTENDERKNYWYKEPQNHISVEFPETVTKCTYSISKGENPGDYFIIFKCTEKKDAFLTDVLVENVKVPQQISITVVPGAPATSKLYRMTGEEIKESNLGSVSVDDKFQMINKLFDKYDNLITNINFELSTLEIKMTPTIILKTHTWSAEPLSQKNGEIIITLKSTYAGEHLVTGRYFPEPKTFSITFYPGAPSADNSELELSKTEAIAGEDVKVYIYPYDTYNNYIDAYRFESESPYQIKYTEGGELKVISGNHNIEERNDKNVLSYPVVFYIKGEIHVNGFLGENPIKCLSCRINIKAKEMDFLKSYVLRFEVSKNDFELLKDGALEKNAKEEPIYKLYPRDEYENPVDYIPNDILNTFTAQLQNQNESTIYTLKLNNKGKDNQEYAEFIIDDEDAKNVELSLKYKELIGGFYDLEFSNGVNSLVYNITLAGDGKGGSNQPPDYQKTALIQQNLKYIAGQTGFMIFEIRTSNNVRRNSWGNFEFEVITCDENDKSFNFIQEKAGSPGVFMITVTSTKSNTYPSLIKCPLTIKVDKKEIINLKPEMEVIPDEVVVTKVSKKYYKEGSETELKDGNADETYVFEVESYDQFNNLAETKQEVVGIKVTYKGGDEVKKTTSETNTTSGYRQYNVPATKAGKYIVNTDKSGPKGLYLSTEPTFEILAGAIDLSKTVIKEKATPIQAGTKPAVTIDVYDKYGNPLYDKYLDKFNVTFIDANNEEHSSIGEYDSELQKVLYTSETPVTIVGNVKVDVIFDDTEKLDTSKVIIVVLPGDPDPKNSILSRETSSGVITTYKNGDSFTVDTKDELILNITIYDKYNNYISNIPIDVEIKSPKMFGNYMQEILFSVLQNEGYFHLDFNDNSAYNYIYQHLVGGKYNLTYTVSTKEGKADFNYNIIIEGGDGKHGNGPYVIEKCVLTPKNTSFIAGNWEQFTLELRTEQGLLYNDDIDLNSDIVIENKTKDETKDSSFKSSITKAGSDYGIYTIKIYSEKKGDYILNVYLTDPSKETKANVGPALYKVYPDKVPDQRYTVFDYKTNPAQPLNCDKRFSFTFILADKFNNTFENRDDIVDNNYLTLTNDDKPLAVESITLLSNKQNYTIALYPKYPPKKMFINVLYNDGENSVICFEEDLVVNVYSEFDVYQTQIVSSNKEKIYVGQTLHMLLYTFDKKGECYDEEDKSSAYRIEVIGPMNSNKMTTKKYEVNRTELNPKNECNNEYRIKTSEKDIYKVSGTYLIKVYGENNLLAQYTQICYPLGYSIFYLDYDFDPNKISILDTISFTVWGTDKYDNKLDEPLLDDIDIYFTENEENTPFISKKVEKVSGQLQFEVSIHVVGSHQLHMTYQNTKIEKVNKVDDLPIFTILPGPCRSENQDNFDLTPLENVQKYDNAYFTFQCYDIYNNTITHGGEQFTVDANAIYLGNDYHVDTAEVIDNEDGTYTVTFIPQVEGTYLFNLLVGKERYGEEIKWVLNKKECFGETSILCPNSNECVSNLKDCIDPPNNCSDSKPFWCLVNNTYTCVRSQTDCDCPEGYFKCPIMNYCVRNDRDDMCPKYLINDILCKRTGYKMFYDGICRLPTSHGPNQRVCPIGLVLCPDLSCRETHDECVLTTVKENPYKRCISQQLVKDLDQCPSMITCSNPDDVVCPDNTCVDNEIKCPALKKCYGDYPYRCANNVCADRYESCSKGICCGHTFSLCSDNVCRKEC